MPDTRYEKIIEAFGGKGYFATTPTELEGALHESLTTYADKPVIINVAVNPQSTRKSQVQYQHITFFLCKKKYLCSVRIAIYHEIILQAGIVYLSFKNRSG